MKFHAIILSFFFCTHVLSQNGITNPGFESVDYTGWSGDIGTNWANSQWEYDYIAPGIFWGNINASVFNDTVYHAIMTAAAGIDPNGGFQIVPPGHGNCVARLGNDSVSMTGVRIKQTWIVSVLDPIIYPSYAVVMGRSGHPSTETNYFTYTIFDSGGDTIFAHRDETPYLTPPSGYSLINDNYVLPWTIDTIDLTAFVGTQVSIEFKVVGCVWGAHFSYCYVDMNPNDFTAIEEDMAHSRLEVFPNPSESGIFHIQTVWNQQPVNVYDLSGRYIHAGCTQTANGWIVDLSQFPKGAYFAQIQTEQGVKHCTLIH